MIKKLIAKAIRILMTFYAGMVFMRIVMRYNEVRRGLFGRYMTTEQVWDEVIRREQIFITESIREYLDKSNKK